MADFRHLSNPELVQLLADAMAEVVERAGISEPISAGLKDYAVSQAKSWGLPAWRGAARPVTDVPLRITEDWIRDENGGRRRLDGVDLRVPPDFGRKGYAVLVDVDDFELVAQVRGQTPDTPLPRRVDGVHVAHGRRDVGLDVAVSGLSGWGAYLGGAHEHCHVTAAVERCFGGVALQSKGDGRLSTGLRLEGCRASNLWRAPGKGGAPSVFRPGLETGTDAYFLTDVADSWLVDCWAAGEQYAGAKITSTREGGVPCHTLRVVGCTLPSLTVQNPLARPFDALWISGNVLDRGFAIGPFNRDDDPATPAPEESGNTLQLSGLQERAWVLGNRFVNARVPLGYTSRARDGHGVKLAYLGSGFPQVLARGNTFVGYSGLSPGSSRPAAAIHVKGGWLNPEAADENTFVDCAQKVVRE